MKASPDRPLLSSVFRIPAVLFIAMMSLVFFSWHAPEASAGSRGGKASLKHARAKKKVPDKSRRQKIRQHPRTVQAKAVYCVDLHRHKPLVSRNADKRLPVASLTKLVTALVVLDHMRLDQIVRVPDDIEKVPKSVVGLKPDDRISVKDLLHGLLICSGNDCAVTLANGFPGGRSAFIRAMNLKARRLGTKHTVFYNPSGLDIKLQEPGKNDKSVADVRSNISTAKEMALIARTAFANKIIRNICHKKSYMMHSSLRKQGYQVRTTNKLLRDNLPLVGGKTGYTARAGHCLASAFFTPGRDAFLIVVLGSPDHFKDTRLVLKKALRETKAVKRGTSGTPSERMVRPRYHPPIAFRKGMGG